MTKRTRFLDEDHNIVSPKEAVFVVHTITDEMGVVVEERWERVVNVDSESTETGELVSIYKTVYE